MQLDKVPDTPSKVQSRIGVLASTGNSSLIPLLKVAGYRASLVSPLELFQTVQPLAIDLLILEADSSTDDAAETTRQLRQTYHKQQLPILLVVNSPHVQAHQLALAVGANDFIEWPLETEILLLRVSNLLTMKTAWQLNIDTQFSLQQEVLAGRAKLDILIENGLMRSIERDPNQLLRHILIEGQRLLHCDAGTLYLVTEQKTLRFTLRTKADVLPVLEIPLYDPVTGAPNEAYVSTYTAVHNTPVLIDDVYQEKRFDLSGTRAFDAATNYRTLSMLSVPMAPRNGDVIGVLQFMNVIDPDSGAIVPFSPDLVGLVTALASQAAVALDNLQLVAAQTSLMESMIRVIATAIDAKSPYTGRHCERVPELAFMLAEAACAAKQGPLAHFNFNTEEEWQEFRIGAWLHDCGKMTTPEYVIDKATKLETIYNRIHEIRTRFEVLLRDAEIARLQAVLDGEPEEQAAAHYASRKTQLEQDFAFIAECNLGSETMDASRIERVLQIAQQTWLRNFDDSLGLAHDESQRRVMEPGRVLPAIEHLLADKRCHVIERPLEKELDPKFGFKIDVPRYLYNYGEVYNLSIGRGTLTAEERYKIDEHMIQGIMMLERMPFPKSLRRVPEYAGTHHETLDGRGYPRRLTAEQLSIPARIMAIVDIFEALTASDRPYKKPKRLSEALRILHSMKLGGRIDPVLFDLFLTSGIYLRYARQYLLAEQIDEVDIKVYLGGVDPAGIGDAAL